MWAGRSRRSGRTASGSPQAAGRRRLRIRPPAHGGPAPRRAGSARRVGEIPGIGKDLAARIREIAETGESAYHRELVAEFPPSVLDILHLQGVGPKTAATLYRELGVRTLDDLEQAARSGRVRALKGMGPK